MRRMAFVSAVMIAVAAGVGIVRAPPPQTATAPDLEKLLPERFGEWRRINLGAAVLPAEATLTPGEAVAYRAYRDGFGRTVTLVAAYGPPLGDSVRLHRPESCYTAQGFAVNDRSVRKLTIGGSVAPIIRLNTQSSTRREAVSYWLRDGDAYVDRALGHEILTVTRGLSGASDGALVRVSSPGGGATAFAVHDRFMKAFADALSPEARALLLAGAQ